LRIRTKEFVSVSWDEFKALLSGIDPETPLGRIVSIRSETDRKVIKNFNKDQKRIYNAWRNRKAESMSPATYDQEMKALEQMFAQMCR